MTKLQEIVKNIEVGDSLKLYCDNDNVYIATYNSCCDTMQHIYITISGESHRINWKVNLEYNTRDNLYMWLCCNQIEKITCCGEILYLR